MERKKLLLGLSFLLLCQMADAAVEIGKTYRIVPDGNDTKSLFCRGVD